jgi:prepilin-type N-terminal cleavage/methylation domain-containing protein
MKNLKADNCGFSLVEIIVTVMIASVITGTVGFGLSLSSGKPAERCARSLASALSHARTTTMGRYRNEITIKNTGSGGYTVNENIIISLNDDDTVKESSQRGTTVGDGSVTLEYSLTGNDSDYKTLSVGQSLTVHFDSGSGALNDSIALINDSESGGTETLKISKGQLKFRISKSGTVKYVTIAQLTGNITTS